MSNNGGAPRQVDHRHLSGGSTGAEGWVAGIEARQGQRFGKRSSFNKYYRSHCEFVWRVDKSMSIVRTNVLVLLSPKLTYTNL